MGSVKFIRFLCRHGPAVLPQGCLKCVCRPQQIDVDFHGTPPESVQDRQASVPQGLLCAILPFVLSYREPAESLASSKLNARIRSGQDSNLGKSPAGSLLIMHLRMGCFE